MIDECHAVTQSLIYALVNGVYIYITLIDLF